MFYGTCPSRLEEGTMALSLADLRTLHAYNAWARARMLAAVAQLDDAASEGSPK